MRENPNPANEGEARFEDYFRDAAAPSEAQLLWQLERQEGLTAGLRALFHGPASLVKLRVYG